MPDLNADAEKWIASWETLRPKKMEPVRDAIRQAMTWAYADAARVAGDIYGGRAHTYASENADTYRTQDHTIASCVKAILARASKPGGRGGRELRKRGLLLPDPALQRD